MKAKVLSVFGGLIMLGVLASLLLCSASSARVEEDPVEPPTEQQREVDVAPLEPAEDAMPQAARLLAEGRLDEAALVVERALAQDPSDVRSWELYVEIALSRASECESDGDYRGAADALERAHKALAQWRQVLVQGPHATQEAVQKLVGFRTRVQEGLDGLAETVIAEAERLYDEGEKPWPKGYDKDKFIEALVLLDSQRVDLLSVHVRKKHAELWTRCYRELGEYHRGIYRLRTALVNGRIPEPAR